MPIVAVRIPQMGEGLQEARLVAVLKPPGGRVSRDEPLYQMETDKAVMDVESPYDGVLVAWLAEPGELLPIGAAVAEMEVAEGVREMPAGHGPAAAAGPAPAAPSGGAAAPAARRTDVPPRTRAYARERGLSEAELAEVPASGARLMPSDVDAFLAVRPAAAASRPAAAFTERPLSPKQRLLASRLARGAHLAVPGTMSAPCGWGAIEDLRARMKAEGGAFQPSAFTMFAYAVARTLREFPAFRSTLVGDSTLRTYSRAHLGIAVALPGDELVLAVVENADAMDWRTFAQAALERIEEARTGRDQATEAVTISLTNMQSLGVRDAVPVVAPPAVATLFLGEVHYGWGEFADGPVLRRQANLALTFDHRVVNGVGAAEFLNAVKGAVEHIEPTLGS
jgi:pyruvate dehydrogenase E2 component (dihydrolipoamide acetyltransferase)